MRSLLVAVVLFACGVIAPAQQTPKKIPKIGFVSVSGTAMAPGRGIETFRQQLREFGYIERQNIQIEYRFGREKPDQIPQTVSELVQLPVDVLVLSSTEAIRAAQQATKTIPIVIIAAFDPVATGLVDSLARPGGNITGITRFTRDLSGKRLELLKEAIPRISRVGILGTERGTFFKGYETNALSLKIPVQLLEVRRGPNPDLEGILQAAIKGRVSALIVASSSQIGGFIKQINELAVEKRLPTMHEFVDWVEGGGLMSYSSSEAESFRRAAVYVDKILKGTKPAELPVEQPMKFEFVINLKTAKQIGLDIPQWTLMKADRVIK
jgi:putative tryptophan/tyrosine transport system substrate-binding protein